MNGNQSDNPYYRSAQAQLAQAGASIRRALERDPHLVDSLAPLDQGALVLALGDRNARGVIHRAQQLADQADRMDREEEKRLRELKGDRVIERKRMGVQSHEVEPTKPTKDKSLPGPPDDRIRGVLELDRRI